MKNNYTTSDISRTLSVSERTARRYIDNHLNLNGNSKVLSKEFFDFIINFYSENKETETGVGQESDTPDRIEEFTENEYLEFQKRLIEYPIFKKNIEELEGEIKYHKERYDTLMNLHDDFLQMHKSTIKSIEQRNFIEAKEKQIDHNISDNIPNKETLNAMHELKESNGTVFNDLEKNSKKSPKKKKKKKK